MNTEAENVAKVIKTMLNRMHQSGGEVFAKSITTALPATEALVSREDTVAKDSDEPAISVLSMLNSLLSFMKTDTRVVMVYNVDSDDSKSEFVGYALSTEIRVIDNIGGEDH